MRGIGKDRATIFALASGAGRAAIAVVRVSGPACAAALARLMRGAAPPERVATLRTIRHPATDEPIDRALVLRFAAPRSFTGEPMAEIHVTGGRAVAAALIGALAALPDLRPAEPGEFAWRAFENGKLDLSQVEGLADLVDAETEAQRRQALRIAGGATSREAEAIRADIVAAMAMLEAQIDFSDQEDVDAQSLDAARRHAGAALARIQQALSSARAGERLRDGFNVVIAGPPNAGKSTLMNALVRRDVSIVSPIPGTTRDAIEAHLDLRGLPVTLVDTAGIRQTDDPVELAGVARARRRAAEADLTLWLTPINAAPADVRPDRGPTLQVTTKCDAVAGAVETFARRGRPNSSFAISAKSGLGLDHLLDAIGNLAEEQLVGPDPALIAFTRHRVAFEDARDHISRFMGTGEGALELMAEDLRLAARALERVAGRIDVEDVLGEIFSRLCIGK